jgi:hypothetical protein
MQRCDPFAVPLGDVARGPESRAGKQPLFSTNFDMSWLRSDVLDQAIVAFHDMDQPTLVMHNRFFYFIEPLIAQADLICDPFPPCVKALAFEDAMPNPQGLPHQFRITFESGGVTLLYRSMVTQDKLTQTRWGSAPAEVPAKGSQEKPQRQAPGLPRATEDFEGWHFRSWSLQAPEILSLDLTAFDPARRGPGGRHRARVFFENISRVELREAADIGSFLRIETVDNAADEGRFVMRLSNGGSIAVGAETMMALYY